MTQDGDNVIKRHLKGARCRQLPCTARESRSLDTKIPDVKEPEVERGGR